MAITITHPATMPMCITFDEEYQTFIENKDIDEVTEIACDMMVEHNFHIAKITNMRYRDALVKIERS